MKAIDMLLLIMLAALWGGSFIFMKLAAPEFGPDVMAALRIILSCAVLLPVLFLSRNRQFIKGKVTTIVGVGVLNSAIPFLLFAYAALSVSAGYMSIINGLTPLWALFIGWLLYGQSVKWNVVVGFIIGLLGVSFMMLDKVNSQQQSQLVGMLMVVGATFLYGFSANLTRNKLSDIPAIVLSASSLAGAAIFMLPIAVLNWPQQSISMTAWVSLLAISVLCTSLAYIFYFRLIRTVGPAKATSVTYLIPVFGMVFGYIFLLEPITVSMIVGCLLIVFGIALTAIKIRSH